MHRRRGAGKRCPPAAAASTQASAARICANPRQRGCREHGKGRPEAAQGGSRPEPWRRAGRPTPTLLGAWARQDPTAAGCQGPRQGHPAPTAKGPRRTGLAESRGRVGAPTRDRGGGRPWASTRRLRAGQAASLAKSCTLSHPWASHAVKLCGPGPAWSSNRGNPSSKLWVAAAGAPPRRAVVPPGRRPLAPASVGASGSHAAPPRCCQCFELVGNNGC